MKKRDLELYLNANRAEAEMYLSNDMLRKAWQYVQTNNFSDVLPYHNNTHILTVVKWCGRILGAKGLSAEYNRALLLAALFHDFRHSGGTKPDADNIQVAIAGLQDFYDKHVKVHPFMLELATGCIRVTEYPFVHEPKTPIQMIIRDADILQSFEPNYKEMLMEGLRHEISSARGEKISRRQYFENTVKFMESVTFYMEEAQRYADAVRSTFICNMRKLAERS